MAEALEWTVDHRSSRTVRWLAWTQVALVDVGVSFALLALIAAVGFGIVVAPAAGYAVAVVLVAIRAVAWLRGDGWLEAAWVSRNDWLAAGSTEADALADAAASPVPEPSLAPAIVAGSVLYVVAFALVGAGALALLALSLVASSLLTDRVGEGSSSGRLDPKTDRLTVDGRSRPLSTVEGCSRRRLGDLELLGVRGPTEIDGPRWLAVPADRADEIVAALDGATARSVAAASRASVASWRHLQAPRFGLSVLAVLVVAGVGGLSVRSVGEHATTGLLALAAGGFVVVCVATAAIVTAVLDR